MPDDYLCPFGNESIKLELEEFLKHALILMHGRFSVGHSLLDLRLSMSDTQISTDSRQNLSDLFCFLAI